MPNPNQNQSLQIAQAFEGFANTVSSYRFAHFANLSEQQLADLIDFEAALRKTSNHFLNVGVNLLLDNVQNALDGLGKITTLLNNDLKTLADINKAIQVAGVVVQLGTAFATANPAGIASALESAITSLSPAVPGGY